MKFCEYNHRLRKEADKMYPNVRAEIARKNITMGKLAEELDITLSTLSLKLKGEYPITLKEAKKIKAVLGCDIPLETLFEEAV